MRFAFAALLLAAASPVLGQTAPQDWNQTYAETGKGHRVGNPDAPVQLIEFVSYSCPHCAEFARVSEGALRLGYVGEGKVAVEVRHVIRNEIDMAAVLITECGPADRFFERHRAMFLAHDTWMAKARTATPAQRARWQTGSFGQQMQAIANDLDFHELMEPQGLGVAELDRCLSDLDRGRTLYQNAAANSNEFAIPFTPSFVINGVLAAEVDSWARLMPLLDGPAS